MGYRRPFVAYVEMAMLQWMALRSFAVTLVANQAVAPLIGLAVWTTALSGRAHVSAYYVALLFVQLLTVSYENHTFSNRIYNGELADDLLRPHPVFLRPLGDNLALRFWHVLLGLPLLVAIRILVPVGTSASDVALAMPSVLLAGALRFLFTYLLALSALWMERAHSVVGFGDTLIFLLGGGAAPAELMPHPLQALALASPFRAMYGLPAEISAGWLGPPAILAGYALQLGWLALLVLLNLLVWRAGIERYTAVGG
jgi:ABC-2 type transport system permease protein